MKNIKSQYSHQDGASFVLYEKIRIEPLRSSERMTLFDVDGNKATLARQYFQLGNQYFKKSEYKESIRHFQSSLKYSYQSPQTHNNLGVLHALINEEQLSLQNFKKSIQLRPKQIFAYINLANMQIKRGEYASGIELYLDLMTQYKQKRIIDNFNKIIKNYNSFYKYTKKYIRSAHKDIEPSTLQDILKLVLEYIPKDAPISHQLLLYSESIVEETDIEKVKGTFEAIKNMYSKLHWNYFQSQFNKSIMYGKLLSEYLGNLDIKSLNLVVCLLMSYFFIEKDESQLSYYFNSLIDDDTPQIKHLKCYQQLNQNYQNLKKIKLLPYLIQSKTQTNLSDPEKQKREVLNTIERIYFYKKLRMYQLAQLLKDKNNIHNLNEHEVEILANSLQDCRYFIASKFLFQKYRKQIQSHYFDYLFQDNILQFSKRIYVQDKKEDFNHQHFISQLDKELYSGECPISRQIEIFSYKILSYFEKGDYKTAIELCEEAQKVYPQKKDKFFQYSGIIYLHKYSINLQKGLLIKAKQMLEKSIQANSKNDESHFIQYCMLYENRKDLSVRHLKRSIQARPQKLKYLTQLASVYTNSPDFRTQINNIVAKLDKQYTKATDFKVKGNIALFYLCMENFDQSYAYFKKSMEDASKQDDTNCEDLLFMYFVNKLVWLYYYLVVEEEQNNFKYQLIFYLIIFLRSPFLFQKYDERTYLFDQNIQKEMGRDLALKMKSNSKSLIEKIKHFDIQHKDIIYPYIFREVFKQAISSDPIVFYADLNRLEPALMESYWTYDIAAQLKQQKILKIKQFIIYVSQNGQLDIYKAYKKKKRIILQIKQSTYYKIKGFLKHENLQKQRQEIINEIDLLMKRFLLRQSHINQQVIKKGKQKCESAKEIIEKSQAFLTKIQEVLNQLKQVEIICLIFQYFLYFLEENSELKSFINKLCQKLLEMHNLNDFFFKLKNYIVEDYISQNSDISLFSLSNYDIQFDNKKIDFSENFVFKPYEVEFIEQENVLRDCIPFYKISVPQWKEIEKFLFAVKLVAQIEKQKFTLKEISQKDFKIENSYIHFYGIKNTVKDLSQPQHLQILQQFLQEIYKKGKKSSLDKCKYCINFLFKKKINYHTFITKVSSILQGKPSKKADQNDPRSLQK